jgi:hypothetical protein
MECVIHFRTISEGLAVTIPGTGGSQGLVSKCSRNQGGHRKGSMAMSWSNCYHLLHVFARKHRPWGVVWLCVMLLMSVCAQATAERPVAVDHSTEMYFPPIGGPQEIGDCTCWSSCYYYNTYTQARDENRDASTGDPNVICSPRFLFALIARDGGGLSAPSTRWPAFAMWGARRSRSIR